MKLDPCLILTHFLFKSANYYTEASAIVPRSEAHGVDFIGTQDYIVRSDIGAYMRTTNLNEGKGIK